MDHHDRRLSVCKSSSSKISKASSALRPPSAASPRPPATLVSADLNNFRRVVQQLTAGTPPPSASSSPVHISTGSSRLQRIAPPPLRSLLHKQHQQNQQPLNQYGQQHQQVSNLPPLQQPHHHYMRHDIGEEDNDQLPQHDFSWLSSILSPPLPYTQVANLNQNPDSDFNACINPLLLSPHRFSALPAPTASDSMWVNALHATPSPRPLSNSAKSLPPLLPLPSVSKEVLESGSGHSGSEAFEWPALSSQLSTTGHSPRLPASKGLLSTSKGQPLLPSSANGRPLLGSSSNGNPLYSSSSSSLLGPSPKGYPLLPSPPAALPPLLPLSPSTTFFNPWFPPWASSPFLPLPFSPSLCPAPLSPGLSPFISSPGGFFFSGTNDYQSKLP